MRPLVDRSHPEISVRRQCELLGVNRSGLYYEPVGESAENLLLMRLLDEQYTRTPFYGSRKMTAWLASEGHEVNRKRVSRLMELLGMEAVYPKRNLSQPGEGCRIYPYLLRGTAVERVNQVWSTDITYIRMAHGFLYLGLRPLERVFVTKLFAGGFSVEFPVDFDASAIGASVPSLGLAFQHCQGWDPAAPQTTAGE
jgi:hypothetical protein